MRFHLSSSTDWGIAFSDLEAAHKKEKHVPIAQTLDANSNLRAQDRMKQLATKPELIIPGHDPAVMNKFTHVTEAVVRIE